MLRIGEPENQYAWIQCVSQSSFFYSIDLHGRLSQYKNPLRRWDAPDRVERAYHFPCDVDTARRSTTVLLVVDLAAVQLIMTMREDVDCAFWILEKHRERER